MVDIPPSILIAKGFKYLVDTRHFDGEDFIIRPWNIIIPDIVRSIMVNNGLIKVHRNCKLWETTTMMPCLTAKVVFVRVKIK